MWNWQVRVSCGLHIADRAPVLCWNVQPCGQSSRSVHQLPSWSVWHASVRVIPVVYRDLRCWVRHGCLSSCPTRRHYYPSDFESHRVSESLTCTLAPHFRHCVDWGDAVTGSCVHLSVACCRCAHWWACALVTPGRPTRNSGDSDAGSYACPAGSTSPNQVLCPKGTYSEAGAGDCTPCPAGRFGSRTGAIRSVCSGQCAAGYHCPLGSVNASGAGACPPGQYSLAGAVECSNCRSVQLRCMVLWCYGAMVLWCYGAMELGLLPRSYDPVGWLAKCPPGSNWISRGCLCRSLCSQCGVHVPVGGCNIADVHRVLGKHLQRSGLRQLHRVYVVPT